MAAGDNKTTIAVVVISLISALGVALISNYDKLFKKDETVAPIERIPSAPPRSSRPAAPGVKSTPSESSYRKMDFGFDGCDVKFGEMKKDVTEADMVRLAIAAGALIIHPSSTAS